MIDSFARVCVAHFAGHFHGGGFFKDENEIVHITFPAIVETSPESMAYSTVKVFEKKAVVEIKGLNGSKVFEIKL